MRGSGAGSLVLLPLRPWIERTAVSLSAIPDHHEEDFTQPRGEASLVGCDSLSWQVFKNPVSILIGGIAAVVLELAEPRVRTGVYEHSSFRADPLARLRRTGRTAMVTVYGARSRAEAVIDRVNGMHRGFEGRTRDGLAYRATDPELLTWVHTTASFGFMQARHVYVRPIALAAQDRYYSEGAESARLYGTQASRSRAEVDRLFDNTRPKLESSALVFEFLHTMQRMPLLPEPLSPLQHLLVKAAVDLLPEWARVQLGLGPQWSLAPWQAALVRITARSLDGLPLRSGPPVQACRRLGLPDDYLYRRPFAGDT